MKTCKTDEELAVLAQQGSSDAEQELVERYWDIASAIASASLISGIVFEDRQSIALQAVIKACRTWKPEKGAQFPKFCRTVINNAIIDDIRFFSRQAVIPNSQISSYDDDGSGELESEMSFLDALADDVNVSDEAETKIDHDANIEAVVKKLQRDLDVVSKCQTARFSKLLNEHLAFELVPLARFQEGHLFSRVGLPLDRAIIRVQKIKAASIARGVISQIQSGRTVSEAAAGLDCSVATALSLMDTFATHIAS